MNGVGRNKVVAQTLGQKMEWKRILLHVKARRKLEDKSMGYVIGIQNLDSQETKTVLMDKRLIEE